jgi:hypothetical protein
VFVNKPLSEDGLLVWYIDCSRIPIRLAELGSTITRRYAMLYSSLSFVCVLMESFETVSSLKKKFEKETMEQES